MRRKTALSHPLQLVFPGFSVDTFSTRIELCKLRRQGENSHSVATAAIFKLNFANVYKAENIIYLGLVTIALW
jgi:hypothetical protein